MTPAFAAGHQLIQPLAQGSDLLVNQRSVIPGEFDDIEPGASLYPARR
ncbi:hypothetical protein LNP25_27215 [Klebsiella variicola subsp. variicola]|nr:hypothetical protein [Klebsiella variicola subsp. variicola]